MAIQSKNKGTVKCKCCKERFVPFFNNSLQKYCTKYDACITAGKNEAVAKREKKERKETLKKKKGLMSHDAWQTELEPYINKIARLIDKGSYCMMCKIPLPPDKRKNGCHYHSKGSNNSIRFNLINIWIGCHSCNGENGGNINGFDVVIRETYGSEFWEYLKFDIVRMYPRIKIPIHEFPKLIEEARLIISELEQKNKTYSIEERISLRHQLNQRLGIYKF